MIHESTKMLAVEKRSVDVKIHRSRFRIQTVLLYTRTFDGGGTGVELGADKV